ncbi:hypothetical protein JCM10021v2_007619 [Rhodotorula toruloides]
MALQSPLLPRRDDPTRIGMGVLIISAATLAGSARSHDLGSQNSNVNPAPNLHNTKSPA